MNNLYCLTNWHAVIDILIICITLSVVSVIMKIVWLIVVLFFVFALSFGLISKIHIFENMVLIKYPYGFIKKDCSINFTDVDSVIYSVAVTKATSEYIKFIFKDGRKLKITLDTGMISKNLLKLIQSKDIKVIVCGTEHNSIEDLR